MTLGGDKSGIGIFIDGSFLEIVREACRRTKGKAPSLKEFSDLVLQKIAQLHVYRDGQHEPVEVHWFRGKFTSNQMQRICSDDRELTTWQIEEQRLSEELAEAGFVTHRRHMCYVGRKWAEKGIDTLLLAEALNYVDTKKPCAVALVGCDGDHITLLEQLKPRGVDSVLVSYDSPDTVGPADSEVRTKTHGWLREAATHVLEIECSNGFCLLNRDESRWAKESRAIAIARTGNSLHDGTMRRSSMAAPLVPVGLSKSPPISTR